MVEDLIDQPQHFPRVGADGKHVVADVTAIGSPADLSQVVGQRGQRNVIKLCGVMQYQDRLPAASNLLQGVLPRGGNDRRVGHVVGIAEPVEGTQVSRRRQLVGKVCRRDVAA